MNPRRVLLLALALMAGCASTTASNARSAVSARPTYHDLAARNDVEGYTRHAAEELTARLPHAHVEVVSPPRTLRVTDGTESFEISLDRPWESCLRVLGECDRASHDFIVRTSAVISARQHEAPPSLSDLRVAVRRSSTIAQYEQALRRPLLTYPIAADLMAVIVVDSEDAARPLPRDAALDLGTSDEVFATALSNTLQELGPLPIEPMLRCDSIATVSRRAYYESTRILDGEGFATLARTMPGPPLVAAPAYDTILVTPECTPASVEAVRRVAEDVGRRSDVPLGNAVFRWTPNGFVAIEH